MLSAGFQFWQHRIIINSCLLYGQLYLLELHKFGRFSHNQLVTHTPTLPTASCHVLVPYDYSLCGVQPCEVHPLPGVCRSTRTCPGDPPVPSDQSGGYTSQYPAESQHKVHDKQHLLSGDRMNNVDKEK